MLGAMLKVNIIRKVLNYSFIETIKFTSLPLKVYSTDLKQCFVTQRASDCNCAFGTLITQMF